MKISVGLTVRFAQLRLVQSQGRECFARVSLIRATGSCCIVCEKADIQVRPYFPVLWRPTKAKISGKDDCKRVNKKLRVGCGPVGKTDAPDIVESRTASDVQVYTDDVLAFKKIYRPREAVKHSVGEIVRKIARTNGRESF